MFNKTIARFENDDITVILKTDHTLDTTAYVIQFIYCGVIEDDETITLPSFKMAKKRFIKEISKEI